jgi:hypothetical protein
MAFLLSFVGSGTSLAETGATPDTRRDLHPIGPFEIASKDGESKLRLQLAAQMRLFFVDRDTGTDRNRTLSVQARRIRPIIVASLLDNRLTFRLHLSTAPGSLELIDLWMDWAAHAQISLRAGVEKIPFTLYRASSFTALMNADWARVTRTFGSERQWGVSVHNQRSGPQRLFYHAGVYAGFNSRTAHAVALPLVNYGAPPTNPSDLTQRPTLPGVHPELVARVSYRTPGMSVRRLSDPEGGPARIALALSATWDLDPVVARDFAQRVAPEVWLKVHGLTLHGVAYIATAQTYVDDDLVLAALGGLAQASYRFNDWVDVSVAYDYSTFTDDIREDALAHAAAEIDDPPPSVGQRIEAHEAVVGANLYLVGEQVMLQTDFAWQGDRLASADHRDNFIVRSQVTIVL